MPRKKRTGTGSPSESRAAVTSITYSAKRKNIPPAGIEAHGIVREAPAVEYAYNPHLPPVLRSSSDPAVVDQLPELLAAARERALTPAEADILADALRRHEPWLEWSGKREKPWFAVEPVALHMHERVSTQAILRVLARQDVQRSLFADPQLDYAKAVQFYRHDVDWANRMILGDSLQVMASLARRENLAGRVQMIYLDPPYGIKFASNFQPQLGQRDVKDRQQDLTREPEMVKAYRDTWTLGIHSYLAYLRDRLAVARELLADRGSIFVQIGDENLHNVRYVMDEVFGPENFIVNLVVQKKGSQKGELIQPINDFVLWYAKRKKGPAGTLNVKFRPIFEEKTDSRGEEPYDRAELPNGDDRSASEVQASADAELFVANPLTSGGLRKNQSLPFRFAGREFHPGEGSCWKTTVRTDDGSTPGMDRLAAAERLWVGKKQIRFKAYRSDFGFKRLTNFWTGLGGPKDPIYVVQTNSRIVERLILMTSDPGDLVMDSTCGSGTTAFAAEQCGRRWITIDTSRVALALAKHRLMTAQYDYYRLRDLNAEDVARNPEGTWITDVDGDGKPSGKRRTFDCRTVPHVTLGSIARNTSIDPIVARHKPRLDDALVALNRAAGAVEAELKKKLVGKLLAKHREEGARAVTDADLRRWLLPGADSAWIKPIPARRPRKGVTAGQAAGYRGSIPSGGWRAWQVPFDSDPDWPSPLREALTTYRAAWRAKMDAVNACIAANAEAEELVDKPVVVGGTVRVAGPFTMEGVIAREEGPDSPIGGAPGELETFVAEDVGDLTVADAEAHLDKMIRLLRTSGVEFADNRNVKFLRLDPNTGATLIHAEGEWLNGDGGERRVAVSIGPEVGNVGGMQVEDAIRDANRKGYDEVVFAGFGFDAAAQEAIDEASHPRLRLHMALISPDVAMGDLLKDQPGSQLFRVFSAPRVTGLMRQEDGDYVVEVEGMDVYDPVSNALYPSDRSRIAAWFLDTDYDGRTFCICQAFFPDKAKWDKLARALGNAGAVDPAAFEALSGFRSLPFVRPARLAEGETWKVAVKVIDPRGNEGLRVMTEGGRWA